MEKARKLDPTAAEASEVVGESVAVLVHGTFAGDPEDSGSRWWQSGSPVSQQIESLLPNRVRSARDEEVFHWSGENSDRARSKAAVNLLRHLNDLEAKGQDYHLVGHSHGGSVIWNTLRLSVLLRRPLNGLRSWTTVGTPFMHHRSRGAMNLWNLMGLIIGLVLLVPATSAPKQLIRTVYGMAANDSAAITLEPNDTVGYAGLMRSPVLAFVEFFGIPIDRRPEGVHVGSFDPAGDLSMAHYFLATPEGLFLLLLMIALSYFFIHFIVLCISPAIESYRIRQEQHLHQRAFEFYGNRWLGIWSPDDEAINGLRATLAISVSFVKRIAPREVVYLSDTFALLSRPYFWLLAPFYNRFICPAVDKKVRNLVVRSAQGSDRPTATLIDVTPVPIADASHLSPPLPALMNAKLLSFANQHAHDMVPKLRKLIASPSFTAGLESFGGQLSGKELVHTGYFDHAEVIKLIAANMAWETEAELSSVMRSIPPWLRKWLLAYKQGVDGNSADNTENGQPDTETRGPLARRRAG
jgi:hypothetical protein